MATCIHPSRSCLPPFNAIPIFPLLNLIYLSPFFINFLDAHCIYFILGGIILPEAIWCCLHTCFLYVMLLELCYVCMPTFIATTANMGQLWAFLFDRLPKALCCCLQSCSVNVVLLVMCCMCILAFAITSPDISQLCTYIFMVYTNIFPEAICCCLQTCNVYVMSL